MDHTAATRGNFVFGVIFVAVLALVVWWRSSSPSDLAPSDLAAFARNLTLDQARAASAASGRPVFVYATASWCGPCRAFKARTLARADVASLLSESFEPVYLDIDAQAGVARSLRVTSVPTLMLFRDGAEIDRRIGALAPEEFLAFLRAGLPNPPGTGQ